VIFRDAPRPDDGGAELRAVVEGLRLALPWLDAIVRKESGGSDDQPAARALAQARALVGISAWVSLEVARSDG
jgi:hypothetical protein